MRLVWSPQAIEDLDSLQDDIEGDNPIAARRIPLRIIESVETMIPENARIGRPGRVPGAREFVVAHTPYVVAYRLLHETIEVLGVYHGARRWPDRL
ncbi:MAG: type II toxin-antitoxin system RelE/ParE family toxin [Hyphomicrobiales bacterium]|nr:type II toxin-antitoxin system RelE/ParE family toxin [Hyphomicrobiales bacterium]